MLPVYRIRRSNIIRINYINYKVSSHFTVSQSEDYKICKTDAMSKQTPIYEIHTLHLFVLIINSIRVRGTPWSVLKYCLDGFLIFKGAWKALIWNLLLFATTLNTPWIFPQTYIFVFARCKTHSKNYLITIGNCDTITHKDVNQKFLIC